MAVSIINSDQTWTSEAHGREPANAFLARNGQWGEKDFAEYENLSNGVALYAANATLGTDVGILDQRALNMQAEIKTVLDEQFKPDQPAPQQQLTPAPAPGRSGPG